VSAQVAGRCGECQHHKPWRWPRFWGRVLARRRKRSNGAPVYVSLIAGLKADSPLHDTVFKQIASHLPREAKSERAFSRAPAS